MCVCVYRYFVSVERINNFGLLYQTLSNPWFGHYFQTRGIIEIYRLIAKTLCEFVCRIYFACIHLSSMRFLKIKSLFGVRVVHSMQRQNGIASQISTKQWGNNNFKNLLFSRKPTYSCFIIYGHESRTTSSE